MIATRTFASRLRFTLAAARACGGPLPGCNTPPSIPRCRQKEPEHTTRSRPEIIIDGPSDPVSADGWSASPPESSGASGESPMGFHFARAGGSRLDSNGPQLPDIALEAPGHFAAAQQQFVQVSSARKAPSELFASARSETPISRVKMTASVELVKEPREFFVVLTDGTKKNGEGEGEETYRIPFSGTETVQDAVEQTGVAKADLAKKKIWVSRSGTSAEMPVDWAGITQRKDLSTNYRLAAGDRVMIQATINGKAAAEEVFGIGSRHPWMLSWKTSNRLWI